jgi:beta-lactamase regulating signal transducer with metallopeptidase domain/biotin carboxyl carrier protein
MIAWWMSAICGAAIRGSAALLLAWVLSCLPRVPSAVRCWAWRTAFAALLACFLWTRPVDLPLLSRSIPTANGKPAADVEPAPDSQTSRAGGRPAGSIGASGAQLDSSSRTHGRAFNASPRISWIALAWFLWLGFLATYAARLAVNWKKTRRLAAGHPLQVRELAELCGKMGVRRPPHVRVHPACRGPLLVGVWRPSIVLPETAVGSPDLRLILAHELAHQKRQDLLWNWLAVLATAALPLHPLVWVGKRRWKLATEAACDAAALAATAANPAVYGRVLVEVATFVPPASGLLTVAVAAESRWLLKRRLSAMQHVTSWSRSRLTTAALGFCIVGVVAAVPWRVVASADEQASSKGNADHPALAPASGAAAQLQTGPADLIMRLRLAPASGPAQLPAGDFNAKSEGAAFISLPRAGIRSLTSGTIQQVSCEEGQRVTKGALLVQLDATELQKALAVAERIVKTSQERYDVMMQMQRAGQVAPQELAAAKLDWDKASDVLQQRQAALDATRIVAPFDGIVEDLKANVGSTIFPGDSIATVYNATRASVDSAVPNDIAPRLKIGDSAAIFSQDGKRLGSGEVVSVGRDNEATGLTSVRVRIVQATVPLTNLLPATVKFHVKSAGPQIDALSK